MIGFLIVPDRSTLQRMKKATVRIERSHADSLSRWKAIGAIGRDGLTYDECDELDASEGGLWPRSRRYCSSQPSRIMIAGRKS
jgi:hypothetical protein